MMFKSPSTYALQQGSPSTKMFAYTDWTHGTAARTPRAMTVTITRYIRTPTDTVHRHFIPESMASPYLTLLRHGECYFVGKQRPVIHPGLASIGTIILVSH